MQSPCLREAKLFWLHHSCCSSPPLEILENKNTDSKPANTSATCRRSFTATTTTSFFSNSQFTNHECLPSPEESFKQFIKAYPQYSQTNKVDQIRALEYYHLCNHVCLDYIGVGLFSYSQAESQCSTAASSATPKGPEFPYFSISHKSVNLKSQLLHDGQGSKVEYAMKNRIMDFLNISQNEYCMVFTANRSSAFKLVAESYPFKASRKLLTVYDCENEALETMVNTSEKRGAKMKSAEFKWPRLRINSPKLRKMIMRKNKKNTRRGLFVFPLQSRMSGANYSYQWMSMAQENGWHVLLDACALGPKDMDSFGLSLIRPDFLVCSFYKVFGDNPTGFGCLFVRKSVIPILEDSNVGGIVELKPANQLFLLPGDSSGTDTELDQTSGRVTREDESNSLSAETRNLTSGKTVKESGKEAGHEGEKEEFSEHSESGKFINNTPHDTAENQSNGGVLGIKCRCLEHVDSLGLRQISSRRRYLINWLLTAVMKLQHPNRLDNASLVRIYGPKIKFDRGPALAFNIYDWKGEKVEPVLVQRLADRNNISLSLGFLQNIWFADKYQQDMEHFIERGKCDETISEKGKSRKTKVGISVVTIALSFLANFEDMYKLWAFIAQFLDADYVEKERWRYTTLNQKTVEV
ncbi:hypothetical protein LIER_15208 [Lithospermum erythrorhizon]|uniref:Aminotransferase class V domain-containing protein n=1 Tax=Lithospermum erythrorhizon TaxID=34254 RepID=A0AAV3Q792_LITER